MSQDAGTDAIQRTTTAVTLVKAGIKDNVVPAEASALINHRIHPADDIHKVMQHAIDAMNGDSRIMLKLVDHFEPTKVSSYNSNFRPFQVIANSVLQVFPDAVLTPGVMVANTDTKHYQHLCDAVYRFQPVTMTKDDISMIHGINERISVENFNQVCI